MDDEMIIGLFSAKDERAISETRKKYGKLLFAVSNNILRCEEDAEECVDDVYIALWNNLPTKKPDNFKAYITTVARNTAFSMLDYKTASKRNADMTVLLSEAEELIPSDETVDSEILRQTVIKTINSFLEKQPAMKRKVFIRRYFFADSVKSISERFGIKENNVKSILFRMRAGLKKCLQKEGIYR